MSYAQLTLKRRFQIETLLKTMKVRKHIAGWMNVSESAISWELNRNGGSESYDARRAHSLAAKRRKAGKRRTKKLIIDKFIRGYVEEKLKLYWSKEQISGRLRKDFEAVIYHETIYRFIYEEIPEWKKYLRQKKGKYRRRPGTKIREKQREEAKKERIDARPDIINKRSGIGD